MPTNILKEDRCHCPSCDYSKFKNSVKPYKLGKRTVIVRGFEPQALDYLIKSLGYKPKDIQVDITDGTPKVQMQTRFHRPDFYIPKENRMVEVKSIGTLGATNSYMFKREFQKIKTNRRNAIKQGFKYNLLVMSFKGERIPLPKNWYELSTAELKTFISK
jgi:hypothetical protein